MTTQNNKHRETGTSIGKILSDENVVFKAKEDESEGDEPSHGGEEGEPDGFGTEGGGGFGEGTESGSSGNDPLGIGSLTPPEGVLTPTTPGPLSPGTLTPPEGIIFDPTPESSSTNDPISPGTLTPPQMPGIPPDLNVHPQPFDPNAGITDTPPKPKTPDRIDAFFTPHIPEDPNEGHAGPPPEHNSNVSPEDPVFPNHPSTKPKFSPLVTVKKF